MAGDATHGSTRFLVALAGFHLFHLTDRLEFVSHRGVLDQDGPEVFQLEAGPEFPLRPTPPFHPHGPLQMALVANRIARTWLQPFGIDDGWIRLALLRGWRARVFEPVVDMVSRRTVATLAADSQGFFCEWGKLRVERLHR